MTDLPSADADLVTLEPGKRTLPHLLARRSEISPERELIRAGGVCLTSAGVVDAVARLAAEMQAAGVERGDRVAILSGNRLELLEAVLAAGWLGAVAVPINTAARGQQLAHMFSNARPRLLIAEAALLRELGRFEDCGSLERIWALDGTDFVQAGAPLEPFPARSSRDAIPATAVQPSDPFLILYTSGTTGVSKGVICPHAQLYWWGVLTARYLGLRPNDVLYTVLPMFHTNALNTFFQSLITGATYSFGRRFSASAFWDHARTEGASATYLLGAMIQILLSRPPSDRDRDHEVRVALSPATPADAAHRFETRFGTRVVDGYGSTETNLVFCNSIEPRVPGTMGRLVPEFDARAVDDDDEEVPDGFPGELVIRGREPHSIASGYFDMPDKTVDAWRNLWFHTGDRVIRGSDGVWTFVDRLKDSIRRRGENISSAEVEEALLTHPRVRMAAAVGVPSELGEEEVMAFVVLDAFEPTTPESLVEHLEPRLAYFAIPRFLEFVDELPLTENGKVRKDALRELGVTDRTWDREAAGYELKR